MKVLGGVYPFGSYGGDVVIDGEVRQFASVRDAENARIAVIFQELSLIKGLTIGENIFLGREPRRFGVIRWEELYSRAQKLLDEVQLPLDPRTPVEQLGIGQQQLVEIAKALSQEARILVLDDPNVSGKLLVKNVGFKVRRGEVLGIAGLMGAGRSELLMGIFGAWPGRVTGEIYVEGKRIRINRPSDAIRHGVGFVTEDRKRFGLVLDQTILNNMTLAGLPRLSGRFITDVDAEAAAGERARKELRVKANSVFTIVGTLSGGNQQKVVLAKWLLTNPRVLFLDEPTRGIDGGAKQEIYGQINRLAKEGLAIVLVPSELPA